MLKKAAAAILLAALLAGLTGCGNTETAVSYAAVTNSKGIEDNDVAAKSWVSVAEYAQQLGKKAGLFIASDEEETTNESVLSKAVSAGALTVVSVGTDMEVPVYKASGKHGKTHFVLVDGVTRESEDEEENIHANTLCVSFSSEQEGFLAGYGAVTEGYSKLAYMAGAKTDEAVKYEAGFVQGIKAASLELKKDAGSVAVTVSYAGSDELTPERMEDALKLYDAGSQVIMTYGSNILKAVIKAAELRSTYVISAGMDGRGESSSVIMGTSIDCEKAVTEALTTCDTEDFKGGSQVSYGAKENCVGLAVDFSTMKSFSEDIYKAEFQKLADGTQTVDTEEQTTGSTEVTVSAG